MFKVLTLSTVLVAMFSFTLFAETKAESKCDTTKQCEKFVDANKDGKCDHASDSSCCKAGKNCKNFVDANKDGKCDHTTKDKAKCCPVKKEESKEKPKCCPHSKK
ncbi:MAG: hypothetical protein JNL74_20950 [Fibrobacteres bacterium]|nr:hypothetical protein [Fibrobacterota bacterium]